ncbi:histidine kinase [Bengtsoniella intestinalis]|uniref:histidine kinase n=1 Tax=Bengtsoniella intestinalis TaxID=3073143 RepID=UPI00391EFD08
MEKSKKFLNFMELIPDAVVVMDVTSDKVLHVNSNCKKLLHITEGCSVNHCYEQLISDMQPEALREKVREQVRRDGVMVLEHVKVKTLQKEEIYFDVRIAYSDETRATVFLVFTRSARALEEMTYRNQRYDAMAEASFSYPFYLNVATKRMEFFGPIREEFQLPPVMENFPQPVLDGGNILEEDLPSYRRMIDRMYKGEPPEDAFRCFTPAGNILKYMVNYVVSRNEDGSPKEIMGDFVHVDETIPMASSQNKEDDAGEENTKLVYQIKAHFFFNTLNTISALCKQDASKADKAILTFASFMRSYMYLINEGQNIPFEQELSLVKSSLAIEKMRFPDSFTYDFDLAYTDFNIPPLCLQPLVENAVLHGLRKTGSHGKMSISTTKTGNMAQIRIADNGVGFDPTILETTSSIGIRNLTKRVALMANGTVSFESKQGEGTVVVIEVPIAS